MATSALNRNQLFDELVSLIRGEVSRPGEPRYASFLTVPVPVDDHMHPPALYVDSLDLTPL